MATEQERLIALEAHQKALADEEAAAAELDILKAACDDECVAEAVHEPHRKALEAAYAKFAQASRRRAGVALPA